MFSLIITVISIALVAALLIAGVYYGSSVFAESTTKVSAQRIISQSTQIASARALVSADGRTLPGGAIVSFPEGYLSSMPVPPQSAYNAGVPSAQDWVYYIPGTSGPFGLNSKISQKTCLEINKSQGFLGIPAAWDGVSPVQCFGPTDSGYTYIYEPVGQTDAGHTAAVKKSVDDAKVVIPTATPGYPRLCPNSSSITTGVCSDPSASPVPAATGFWVVQATVGDTPALTSKGYAAACPAGAVDPTGPGVNHPPSKPGEPLAADGDIMLGWMLPPSYDIIFSSPLSRTWCIPASESDVIKVGSLASSTSGAVQDIDEIATPANTDMDLSYSYAANQSAVLTANGVQWTLLATGFYSDTWLPSSTTQLFLTGRKVAIGKVPTASFTYFVNSPSVDYAGYNYKINSAKVVFSEAQPPCVEPFGNVPLGTGGAVTSIKSSTYNTAILKQDGSVWLTGVGYGGTYSRCEDVDLNTWTLVAKDTKAIFLDGRALYLVKNDSSLWMSGDPNYTDGTTKFRKIIDSNVKQVGTALNEIAYLRTDGTLWYKGSNKFAARGNGTEIGVVNFEQVDSGVASMGMQGDNLMWIKNDHSLWVTGGSGYGKLGGLGSPYPKVSYGSFVTPGKLPLKIADGVKLMRSIGVASMYVKDDGTVYASGYDQYGCGFFGAGTWKNYSAYTKIGAIAGLVNDAIMDSYNIRLIGADGKLWAAGCNGGAFGNGTTSSSPTFVQIASGAKMFSGGGSTYSYSTVYLDQSDVMHATGINDDGQFGNGTNVSTLTFGVVAY